MRKSPSPKPVTPVAPAPSPVKRFSDFLVSDSPLAYGLFGVLLILCWCALRLPWIACDGGVLSIWEYGYAATDEGYYLGGGKEKFLFGRFVNMARHESYSYGFSAGTHLLSWLAHILFGLSTWAWRLPFVVINLTAWIALYHFIAKRSRPFLSFLMCTVTSCTPLLIAYERTASNDVLIGSLLILSYIAASQRRRSFIPVAALLVTSIILVKPAVYVLLPITLCAILSVRKFKHRGQDAAAFALCCAASLLLFKGLLHWLVRADAAAAGLSTAEIIRQTTTHYPLPNLLDIPALLKGLASFPRTPANLLLGVWSVLMIVCPLTLVLRRLAAGEWRRFDYRMLLYLMIPAYAAAISIMNTLYTHYFIPVIMLFPIVWLEMRRDLRRYADTPSRYWLKLGIAALTILLLLAGLAVAGEIQTDPQRAQKFFSMIYNLPAQNVWGFTWPYCLGFGTLLITAGALLNRGPWRTAHFIALTLAVVGCLSVSFSSLPAYCLAPLMKQQAAAFLGTIAITLGTGSAFIFAVFYFPRSISRSRCWFYLLPGLLLLSVCASPHWQRNLHDTLQPGTQHHQKAAAELARLLPPNAVVIGERSNQLFLSTPIRTATTFAHNSNPTAIIKALTKAEPNTPLFALIDSQHAYCVQHYQKAQTWCALQPLTKVRLPSFGDGRLTDIHLCSIKITNPPPD